MSEPAALADHLEEQTDEILAVWRASVQRVGDVPEARKLAYNEFIDHVPEILDRIADRLRGARGDTARPAQQHGSHRWKQGYDIAEIVKELGHLRAALGRATAEYARNAQWDISELERAYIAIHEGLDDVTAESIRQFQEDSRQETQEALAEVKKRQAALEQAWYSAKVEQSKLRAVISSLPIAVWVTDRDGTIIGANPEAAQFLEAIQAATGEAGDAVGLGLGDLAPQRDDGGRVSRDELPSQRALRGETVKQDELVWIIDGAPRTVSINAAPLADDAGAIIGSVVALIDVSERKRLESHIEHQRQLAEESSLHKSRLIAALSHDARTPLHAVVLAAQLLEIHFKDDVDSEVQQCLSTIRRSVRNVLDLLGDLLDLTKIDAGAVPVEASRFALEAVLAECAASIEPQAHVKGLAVRVEPGSLAGVTLETDRSKLKQILANLLSNALRYTHRGHIRLWGERRQGEIRFSVEDTGVGINAEDRDRIFEEFTTVGPSEGRTDEGTGLGLTISLRLARLLGGDIAVESQLGVGSTFTLVLPDTCLSLTLPSEESLPELDTSAGGVIVVAEDHEDSRKTLAKVLRKMGYHALEASNGREVLDFVRMERPLAILMDINMPGMDGVEATLFLRGDPRYRDVPIFALTGDVTIDNQNRIGDAGVNGYLEKPVTWDALSQALGSLGKPRR